MDSHTETAALIVAAVLAMLTNVVRLLRTVFSVHTNCLKARHTRSRRAGSSSTETMLYQYRWTYFILMIVEPIIITAIQATFFALSWNNGDNWSLYLTSSIIISSMVVECIEGSSSSGLLQRSFSPYPLFSVLTICLTHFVSGTVIEGQLQSLGRAFSSASIALYRLWIVWEWARLVKDTSTNKVLMWMKLSSCIVACLAATYPLFLSSRMRRLLLLAVIHAAYNAVMLAIPILGRPSLHYYQKWKKSTSMSGTSLRSADSLTHISLQNLRTSDNLGDDDTSLSRFSRSGH